MNTLVESFNLWGERFLGFAWPMLWQSSVLIAVLFVLDFAIRRRVRATVRYALWMLVLIKLVLPTSLSLPTSPGYWVQAPAVLDAALVVEIPPESPRLAPEPASIVESFPTQWNSASALARAELPLPADADAPLAPVSPPSLRWPAFTGLSWLFGVVALLLLAVLRGRLAWRLVADASDAPDEVQSLVGDCACQLGVSSRIAAKVTDALPTPVVCGLFRPVILLPKALASRLAPEQLQAVLLHELAHVRRGDLWVSHLQTALQILHFYNPLLWLANARIRRVREEAVDEMVLVALADNADVYPETLLTVAKLSRQSPTLAFGLIGILESKRSLGARIRLMLLRPWPKSARLGFKGIIALLVLGAMLLPMSCAKNKLVTHAPSNPTVPREVSFEIKFVELPEADAKALREKISLPNGSSAELRTSSTSFWAFVLTAPQAKILLGALESAPNTSIVSASRVATVASGQTAHVEVVEPPTLVSSPATDQHGSATNFVPGTTQIPLGPMVDVTPVVSSDGRSLRLTIVPTITEFLGDDEPSPFPLTIDSPIRSPDPLAPPTTTAVAAEERAARRTKEFVSTPSTAQLPLPRIRVRQLVTIANSLDGQPVLLGGLISERVQKIKEKVPVLGDLPTFGRFFRSESAATPKKSLLIFITPTIVDSAGNPVHSDADMPFRKNSIPPQKRLESPRAAELRESKAHLEATEIELNKVERGSTPEKTTGAGITVRAQALPATNSPVPTNLVRTSPGRQAIQRKLDTIRLDDVNFERAPLSNVVRQLYALVKQRDPDGAGINFIISDEAAGVTVSSQLQNARLAEVLDAVVKSADQPIRISVEDYAVVFSARPAENALRPFNTRSGPGLAFPDGSGIQPGSAITAPKLTLEKPPGPVVTYEGIDMSVQRDATSPLGRQPALRIDEQGRYWLGTNALSLDDLRKVLSATQTNSGMTLPVGIAGNGPERAISEFAKLCSSMGVVAVFIQDSAPRVAANTPTLHTRIFNVDPNTFYQGASPSGFSAFDAGRITAKAREFFATLGLDFATPKVVFFNDRAGQMFVRATLGDLAIIEDALHVLNAPPPQVKIEVRFVELAALGGTAVDWYLGNLSLTNTVVSSPDIRPATGQSAGSSATTSGANLGGTFPGTLAGNALSTMPTAASSLGILTGPQLKSVIAAMEKRADVDLIVAPTVTTLSGRQAHIEVTDLKTFLSGINPQALVPPGVTSSNGQAPIYLTNQVPFGPVLDIVPVVSADGFSVGLMASGTVNEWLGYGDTSEDAAVQVYVDGMVQSVKRPRPRIRVRTMVTTISVWDGQTLMVGNPKEVILENDAAGKPTETPGNSRKRLFIFITPTIIDPAGNPIHTDADLPFRTNSIPAQNTAAPR